jgi:two-component system NtrC family sensor kinase
MPNLAFFVRHASTLIWLSALAANTVAVLLLGFPSPHPLAWLGVVSLTLMISIGDWFAIELDDGTTLSPVVALLIAGLSMVGWPLLLVTVLIGTCCPGVLHLCLLRSEHRSGYVRDYLPQLLNLLGSRLLIVGLLAPMYPLFEAHLAIPYSTPFGMLGLMLMGALVYTTVISMHLLVNGPAGLAVVMHGSARWYVPAMIPFGGMFGVLWSVGPWAFLLGLAPLMLAHHVFRDQVQLQRAATEFAVLSNQRESLAIRLERLQALATTMIASFDVSGMLELLRERLAALLDAENGWVVLRNDDGSAQLLVNSEAADKGEPLPSLISPESYTKLFERDRVVLLTDDRMNTLAPQGCDTSSWKAVMSIPLVGERQVLGVICLSFTKLRGLDHGEQRMLTSFAHQAAIEIEHARMFDELHRKQDELIQSSKMAAVGTFAAGIAHEFNNLLAGMLGHAELGYRIDDEEEKNRSLEVVIQSCQRGRSITKGLLTFARRHEHKRELADVTDAINETMMLVEVDLRKSNITVEYQLEPVPLLFCDLGQLAQVVLNLVSNARDAMKPDGGTLTVGLRERDGAIEISVTDTGSGIAPEIRDTIFEPFVTTKGALGGSQTPGTGLGLSVSYGIVREHGGEILVDSTVGVGTTMTVRLPLQEAEVRAVGV